MLVIHFAHEVEHFVAYLEDALLEPRVPARSGEVLEHHDEHLPPAHAHLVVLYEAVGQGFLHAAGPHALPDGARHLLEVARVQMVEHVRAGAGEVATVILVYAGEGEVLEYPLQGEVSSAAK